MCLPGSKIPEWLSRQCVGSTVTVQLPLKNKILGFAICGNSNFKCPHYASDLSATCFCTFKGHGNDYSFSFYLLDWSAFVLELDWSFKSKRFLKSDHMFMGYVPWPKCISEGEGEGEEGQTEEDEDKGERRRKKRREGEGEGEEGQIEEGEDTRANEHFYTEATFTIVPQSGGYTRQFREPVRYHSIRNCGVHLFYANHEEEVQNPSTTPTISHQDFYTSMLSVLSSTKRSREVSYVEEPEHSNGDTSNLKHCPEILDLPDQAIAKRRNVLKALSDLNHV